MEQCIYMASEEEAERILANPLIVDNGDWEVVVDRKDVAKVIANFEPFWKGKVYDPFSMDLLATTFGNFLNKAKPEFRAEIIDELIKYQKEPDDIDAIPAVDSCALEAMLDD